jgi:hypothetical protein
VSFVLFSIAWLAVLMFSLSLCRAASRVDDAPAVRHDAPAVRHDAPTARHAERIAISYVAEHEDALVVGTAEQLPPDSQ